jgi:hypothetical protein
MGVTKIKYHPAFNTHFQKNNLNNQPAKGINLSDFIQLDYAIKSNPISILI